MKLILAAMCALVAIFMGGCAIMIAGAGPLLLLPAGVALLNVFIIGALYGWKVSWTPAFYILGLADIVIALALATGITSANMGISASDAPMLWGIVAVVALKGILSFVYAGSRSSS
jgi:hypothetical protein